MQVSVLGAFDFAAADGSRPPLPAGAQRLLAFLALRNDAVSRRDAAGSLWPDATDERASSSLRTALSRLDTHTRDAVAVEASTLRLADTVDVDFRESQHLAHCLIDDRDGVDAAATDEGCTGALAVLSHDVLPDWYDDWVVPEAEEWRQLRIAALEALSDRLRAARRYAHAMTAALSAVRVEPLREHATAAVIRVHLAEDNRADALREFRRYRARLQRELGVEPTDDLYEVVGIAPAATARRGDPRRDKWSELRAMRSTLR